jgi:uncharacterized phage protein (TIGR02220 family)
MAENKKSFILYCDQKGVWDKLDDAQAGRLIKHVIAYVNDENPEAPDFITELAFEPIKASLKRDLKKWEKQQTQRSEAGKRSAEVRKRNAKLVQRDSTSVNERSVSSTVNGNVNVSVNDSVNVIVSYLNSRVGSSFKASTDKTKRMINARLKEGFTVEDFKQVIETKAEEWENDPKFCKFLRPETLFSNKFESYLNQQQAGQSREDELKLHLLKHLRDVQSEDYIDEPTDVNRMRRLS